MSVHFFTACWSRQLAQVFLLADQLAQHHPDSLLWVGWMDQPFDVTAPANVRMIQVGDIPGLLPLAERYTKTEFLHISRVWLGRHLLNQDALIFLEPETQVLRPLTEVVVALEQRPAVLFSQWLQPHPDTQFPDSKYFLNYGTYFSGIWAIRPDAITDSFLAWWCQNLEIRGGYRLCEGQGSDQLWLDMAPALFAGVLPLRNAAYGIHVGNAFERTIAEPITLHHGGLSYQSGQYASYLTNRPMPAYFKEASKRYKTLVTKQPVYNQTQSRQPAFGLPDPLEPVSLQRQHWAAWVQKWIKTINTYQPDFMFRQSQPQ
ncbi:hypothetical protein [Siphonobacter sp.]|uniref:hypothetical protein n=1 Tax=Siphonobacter sp. TaxID=1869184 RepID=UPI003B3A544C